jgi:hypothetical protein
LGPEGTHVWEAVIQQQLVHAKGFDGCSMGTDPTAQAKHMAYPTDTTLLDKVRRQLLTLIGEATAAGW